MIADELNINRIVTVRGRHPGKVVTVLAGVHGDEKAGVEAMQSVLQTIRISSGTVARLLKRRSIL